MGRKPVDVLRVVMAVSAALFLFVLAMPTLAVGESDSSSNTFPMYRVYNRWSGEHLFTADAGEYASLGSIGWKQGGVAWKSPASGNPVWRLYNPYSGDHFYTGDANEYARLGSIGWRQEGRAFYSAPDMSAKPIYRLFNPWLTQGTHLFTTDASEYAYLGSVGWQQEGVAFYGASERVPLSKAFATLYDDGELVIDGSDATDAGRKVVVHGSAEELLARTDFSASGGLSGSGSNAVCARYAKKISSRCELVLSGFDNVGFSNWYSLEDISGLSNWDVTSFRFLKEFFWGCATLSDISPLSSWDTSKVTNMGWMFNECSSLHDLTPLASWDVSNVSNMEGMFTLCNSVSDLRPLSKWNVSKVKNAVRMFYSWGSVSLKDATALDSWQLPNDANTTSMFPYGCKTPSWYVVG